MKFAAHGEREGTAAGTGDPACKANGSRSRVCWMRCALWTGVINETLWQQSDGAWALRSCPDWQWHCDKHTTFSFIFDEHRWYRELLRKKKQSVQQGGWIPLNHCFSTMQQDTGYNRIEITTRGPSGGSHERCSPCYRWDRGRTDSLGFLWLYFFSCILYECIVVIFSEGSLQSLWVIHLSNSALWLPVIAGPSSSNSSSGSSSSSSSSYFSSTQR